MSDELVVIKVAISFGGRGGVIHRGVRSLNVVGCLDDHLDVILNSLPALSALLALRDPISRLESLSHKN